MTTITILGGDWEIAFEDETVGGSAVAGLKMVRRPSGAGTTVYTTLQLYSAIAEVTDEFTAMGFSNPMLPVTPNAFTMENKYFIPRRDTEFLRDGAITANWTVEGTPNDGVYRKPYTVVTNFVDGDIGRQVVETTSGDTGTLLDFEQEPDGQWVAWIRPDTSGDTFALSTTISVTADGGTGSNTGDAAASSGTTLYSAIQVIGAVPTATEVYLYQNRVKMTDYLGNFQWWATDPTVSLGIIDILVRVRNVGTLIAEGDVEVFGRRYTSLYDNFRLNVAAGGKSSLPLASAPDINNTTGYARVTSDAWDAGWDPAVGDVFQLQSDPAQKGVITAVSGTGPVFTIDFYHTGNLVAFGNNDIIEDIAQTGDITLDSAESATPDGPTDSGSGEGGTVTITLGATTKDHDGDGTAETYSVEIDAQGPGGTGVPAAKVYERIKYVCRRGAPNTDLFGAGVNLNGEEYRGLEFVGEYDANTGTPTEGDDATNAAKATFSALWAALHSGASPTYATFLNIETSLQSIEDDDVIDDETSDDVTIHAGGTLAFNSGATGAENATPVKASPFGTFTGTVLFGARGVAFINPADADTQNYVLTDDLGFLRSPPNTVSYSVTNTVVGDRVLVARDTGVAGVIDKDQFGGLAAPAGAFNGLSDVIIRVAGSIDTEVPPAGYVRIVETTLQEEHHYVYDSLTLGANDEFNLRVIPASTATAGTSPTALVDSGGDFVNDNVEPGMLIHDTTNDDVYEVVTVTDANNLVIVQVFGTGGVFASGDTYEINELIQDYAATDDVFDLILDKEAESTSESNTFVKTLAANFDTVVNVRNGKDILPFTQNQTVNDGGASVTVVRQPDTIAV